MKTTNCNELVLKTSIVFRNLEELQEAIDLGLKRKQNYQNGSYPFPMVQGVKHSEHCSLFYKYISSNALGLLQGAKLWKDVRKQYISPDMETTNCNELVLETSIVFRNLKELQEAINLGLKHKEYYQNGTYPFPMVQEVKHDKHSTLASKYLDSRTLDSLQGAKLWKDVRKQYISKYKPKYIPKAGDRVIVDGCNPPLIIREFIAMTSEGKYLCWDVNKSDTGVWGNAEKYQQSTS